MSAIDFETAELMFAEFADNWRIKTDTSKFKKDDLESFEQSKERIIDCYMDGRLENIDNKTLEYKFAFPEDIGCTSIKIRRPRGSTYMQADSGKKDDAMAKMFFMLSEMTGKNNAFYSKVDGVDIKTLTAITTLFFGS
jgi:hypothetical protein